MSTERRENEVQVTDPESPWTEPEEETLPSYKVPLPLWTQLFRFLIAFFIATFILAAGLLLTNARMPDPAEVRPLPDLFLEWLPKVAWFETFTNLAIGVLNVTLVYTALKLYVLHRRATAQPDLRFPFKIPGIGEFLEKVLFGVVDCGRRPFPVKNAYVIAVIRFLTVYMVMMLYRTVAITVTSYPATDNHCQHPQVIERPWLNMLLTVVTLGSGAIHCGDLMFSGHTIILCLSFSLSWVYGAFLFKHIWYFRLYLVFVLLFAFFSILVSRSHYTDDIVVAAYSTVTTFMLLAHHPDGAPWQLQVLIRYWPCPMSSENPHWVATHAARRNGVPPEAPAVDVFIEDESVLVDAQSSRASAVREMSEANAAKSAQKEKITKKNGDIDEEAEVDEAPAAAAVDSGSNVLGKARPEAGAGDISPR